MNHHIVEKEYRDFADDIEAVSIHYLCVPTGADADWDNGRVTRFMPLVEPGMRRLSLKLPVQLVDPRSGRPVSDYYSLVLLRNLPRRRPALFANLYRDHAKYCQGH